LATIASRSGIFFDSSRSTFYFVKDRSLVAWAPLRQVWGALLELGTLRDCNRSGLLSRRVGGVSVMAVTGGCDEKNFVAEAVNTNWESAALSE